MNEWTKPSVVLTIIGMGTTFMLFLIVSLFKVNDTVADLYNIAAVQENRLYNLETGFSGLEGEIDIVDSRTLGVLTIVEKIQGQQERQAFYNAITVKHQERMFEAGLIEYIPIMPEL